MGLVATVVTVVLSTEASYRITLIPALGHSDMNTQWHGIMYSPGVASALGVLGLAGFLLCSSISALEPSLLCTLGPWMCDRNEREAGNKSFLD